MGAAKSLSIDYTIFKVVFQPKGLKINEKNDTVLILYFLIEADALKWQSMSYIPRFVSASG